MLSMRKGNKIQYKPNKIKIGKQDHSINHDRQSTRFKQGIDKYMYCIIITSIQFYLSGKVWYKI